MCVAVCPPPPQVELQGDVPCGLHGGPLLGVALKRMTASGAELSGEDASPVMQFFSWNGVSKVGSLFVVGRGGVNNSWQSKTGSVQRALAVQPFHSLVVLRSELPPGCLTTPAACCLV